MALSGPLLRPPREEAIDDVSAIKEELSLEGEPVTDGGNELGKDDDNGSTLLLLLLPFEFALYMFLSFRGRES